MSKLYFFIMTESQPRIFYPIAKVTGVVAANTEEEAEEKAWKFAGNDYRHHTEVQEINPSYKSEI